ncbi:MAG TPA: hypothetical protein VF654_05475 [Pyrinomonadaceae bacterium]|jgi:hypothetical protein
MTGGGLLATAFMMAVTYASGWLLDVSGRLGDAWAHITPGQAAFIIGLLTYCTHHGKEPARRVTAWAAGHAVGALRRAPLAWLSAVTVVALVAIVLLARAAFGG